MEQPVRTEEVHTKGEVANYYTCQKLVKDWHDKGVPSSQAIPVIHSRLMAGIDEYQSKGLVPLMPGTYRTTNVTAEGRPENFFAENHDVPDAMRKYSVDLDRVLGKEPVNIKTRLEETVNDAAWAYFTFVRIHPFLDGNGRMGRMILRRVMMGRGYKDIIFQARAADGRGRDRHVTAMNASSDSGNLAHLELYLLEQLKLRYLEDKGKRSLVEIESLIEAKRREIEYQTKRRDLTEIWEGFKGLRLDGVTATDYSDVA